MGEMKKRLSLGGRFGSDMRPGFAVLTAIGTLRPTGRRPAILMIYGAEGSRTPDLCSAIAALSQLSYSPSKKGARHPAKPGRTPVFNDTTPLARGRTVDT